MNRKNSNNNDYNNIRNDSKRLINYHLINRKSFLILIIFLVIKETLNNNLKALKTNTTSNSDIKKRNKTCDFSNETVIRKYETNIENICSDIIENSKLFTNDLKERKREEMSDRNNLSTMEIENIINEYYNRFKQTNNIREDKTHYNNYSRYNTAYKYQNHNLTKRLIESEATNNTSSENNTSSNIYDTYDFSNTIYNVLPEELVPKYKNTSYYLYRYTEFVYSSSKNMSTYLQYSNKNKAFRTYVDNTALYKQQQQLNLSKDNINKLLYISIRAGWLLDKLLSINTRRGNLYITKCFNDLIIGDIIKSGASADLVIFIYIDFSLNENSFAFSKTCGLEDLSYRPVAGYIGISPYIDFDKDNWENYFLNNLLHHFFHIIGFDIELFDLFFSLTSEGLKAEGNYYDKVKVKVSNDNTDYIEYEDRYLIKSPRVLVQGQSYYSCDSFSGQLMHIDGLHWDEEFMYGDLMTKNIYSEQSISLITQGVLEDSGWYMVNEMSGGLFRYMMGIGCDYNNRAIARELKQSNCNNRIEYSVFNSTANLEVTIEIVTNNTDNLATSTDKETQFNMEENNITTSSSTINTSDKSISPSSSIISVTNKLSYYQTCSLNYMQKEICILNTTNTTTTTASSTTSEITTTFPTTSSSFPLQHRLKNNNKYFPGYCVYSNKNTNYTTDSFLIEEYKKESRCFMSNLRLPNNLVGENITVTLSAVCLEAFCNFEDKTVSISIEENIVICPIEGGPIRVVGYDGFILCPKYYALCSQDTNCFDIESCILKLGKYKYIDNNPKMSIENNYLAYDNLTRYEESVINDLELNYDNWYREEFGNMLIFEGLKKYNNTIDNTNQGNKDNNIGSFSFESVLNSSLFINTEHYHSYNKSDAINLSYEYSNPYDKNGFIETKIKEFKDLVIEINNPELIEIVINNNFSDKLNNKIDLMMFSQDDDENYIIKKNLYEYSYLSFYTNTTLFINSSMYCELSRYGIFTLILVLLLSY